MTQYLCEAARVSNPMHAHALPRSRPPAVSGLFYDADPHRLAAEVRRLVATADQAPTTRRAWAIIVPHAGYAYSGEVAATAFKVLEPFAETLRRVVLIGPAHYVPFTGMAIPTTSSFETPLGPVPLDREALRELSGLPGVRAADEPHAPEHSLEVELPFLQTILPRFTLVPLLVGDASPHEVADVLGRVWNGPETVAVISSDLSHFHDYENGDAPRRSHRRDDRSWLVGRPRPGRSLRLSGHSRPSPTGYGARARSAAASPAKLGRYRRPSRLSRGLRGMAVW
jgi:AmmeMemoRadiSam system protein B